MFLRTHTTRFVLCAGIALLAVEWRLAAQNPSQDHAGTYSQSDIVSGSQLYTGQCASCHGAGGDAVGNVDLRRGRFRNASSDDDLKRVISNGVAGTAMPAFKFSDAELTGLVAYIRSGLNVGGTAVRIG